MGDQKFKRYFFVDMENVHRNGLTGIGELTSKDCVRIYYSNPLENIPLELHMQIMACAAKFEYIRVDLPIKNAADCMILFDLRDIAVEHKKSEFIIISNDSDFDKPIEGFRERSIDAKKLSDINVKEALEKEEQVRKFIDEHFKDITITGDRAKIIEKTVRAVVKAKTRSEVNNNLMKIYDHDSIKMIFNELKPLIKDLPGK